MNTEHFGHYMVLIMLHLTFLFSQENPNKLARSLSHWHASGLWWYALDDGVHRALLLFIMQTLVCTGTESGRHARQLADRTHNNWVH